MQPQGGMFTHPESGYFFAFNDDGNFSGHFYEEDEEEEYFSEDGYDLSGDDSVGNQYEDEYDQYEDGYGQYEDGYYYYGYPEPGCNCPECCSFCVYPEWVPPFYNQTYPEWAAMYNLLLSKIAT